MHIETKNKIVLLFIIHIMLRHIFIFDNGTCVHTAHPLCNYKIIYTIIITLLRNSFRKKKCGGYLFSL